jgi:hypothetical protein
MFLSPKTVTTLVRTSRVQIDLIEEKTFAHGTTFEFIHIDADESFTKPLNVKEAAGLPEKGLTVNLSKVSMPRLPDSFLSRLFYFMSTQRYRSY